MVLRVLISCSCTDQWLRICMRLQESVAPVKELLLAAINRGVHNEIAAPGLPVKPAPLPSHALQINLKVNAGAIQPLFL